jgi:epoxyqueuosine reductase
MSAELAREVESRALALGFAKVGFARATALDEEGARLRAWLSARRHGEMKWIEETADVRIDPRDARMLASARTIVALATPFAREGETAALRPGVVARYARGRDYHNVLGTRLKKLAAWLRKEGFQTRHSVDSMPVFERAWAQRAGLGFIGKNCCLIVPGLGSHVFLSTLVTAAELPESVPMEERCGSCRRCLDACPTSAFVAERSLDARLCIAYLTIEQRGSIAEELRAPIGDRLFGCDVCQDVCPFNKTAPASAEVTAAFREDERLTSRSAGDLLAMDDASFETFSLGTPLRRPGRDGLARNAAIVLGNTRDKRHLPVLREAAASHASAVVREAAAWAIDRVERER